MTYPLLSFEQSTFPSYHLPPASPYEFSSLVAKIRTYALSVNFVRIEGLKANDILKELQTNNIMSSTEPFQDKCEVNIDVLGEWQLSALEEHVTPIVKGGRWKPEQCHPQFDSETLCCTKIITLI